MLAKLHRAEEVTASRSIAEPFRWSGLRDGTAPGPSGFPGNAERIGQATVPSAVSFGEQLVAVQSELAELRSSGESKARESYQAGFEEGRRQGLAQNEKELESFRKQIASSLQSVAIARQQAIEQADEDLVHLGVAIAEKILHRQVQIDPEALKGLIRSSLERLSGRSVHCVRVHPDDRPAVEAEFARKGPATAFRLGEDPSLPRGALLFETDFGVLDCSISTQLEEIERGLVDRLRRSER